MAAFIRTYALREAKYALEVSCEARAWGRVQRGLQIAVVLTLVLNETSRAYSMRDQEANSDSDSSSNNSRAVPKQRASRDQDIRHLGIIKSRASPQGTKRLQCIARESVSVAFEVVLELTQISLLLRLRGLLAQHVLLYTDSQGRRRCDYTCSAHVPGRDEGHAELRKACVEQGAVPTEPGTNRQPSCERLHVWAWTPVRSASF